MGNKIDKIKKRISLNYKSPAFLRKIIFTMIAFFIAFNVFNFVTHAADQTSEVYLINEPSNVLTQNISIETEEIEVLVDRCNASDDYIHLEFDTLWVQIQAGESVGAIDGFSGSAAVAPDGDDCNPQQHTVLSTIPLAELTPGEWRMDSSISIYECLEYDKGEDVCTSIGEKIQIASWNSDIFRVT